MQCAVQTTAELIEMQFKMLNRVGPRYTSPTEKGNFDADGRPIVKFIDYRPCAASLRPTVKLL